MLNNSVAAGQANSFARADHVHDTSLNRLVVQYRDETITIADLLKRLAHAEDSLIDQMIFGDHYGKKS